MMLRIGEFARRTRRGGARRAGGVRGQPAPRRARLRRGRFAVRRDRSRLARAAAKAAVANQPFEIEGPMRERYFSSAGDSRFDLTEIQFPLRNTGVLP